MSTVVDERIVKMMMDNNSFEKGAKATLKTLEALAEKLHVLEAAKGLTELSKTVASFPVQALSGAAGGFDALIARATVLNRVIGDVYNTIKSTVNSLVVAPVKTGFAEYEEKMGAVQTIMLSTGKSLDVVMDRLEELNLYADKTIYSFSDMTNNIAKFTNAGVDLDIAVKAIQGLSNEAAVSGATAMQASRAMYNISQALSMGYMQYIDWKSIENANMATVEFKQNLVNTALAMGTLSQETVNGYGSIQGLFKDELKNGWLTNDVLLSTLQMYTDETTELGRKATAAATEVRTLSMLMDTLKEAAQSGWGQSWEIVIGDYEESKKLFTRISNAIGGLLDESAKSRNALLKQWKALGGRESMIESIATAYNNIRKSVKLVKDTFNEVFPKFTGSDLKKVTDGIGNFLEKLKLSEKQSNTLARAAKGIFNAFKIAIDVVSQLKSAFDKTIKPVLSTLIQPIINGVVKAVDVISGAIQKIRAFLEEHPLIYDFFANTFTKAIDLATTAFTRFADYISGFKLPDWMQEIVDWGVNLFNVFAGHDSNDIYEELTDGINKLGEATSNVEEPKMPSIKDMKKYGKQLMDEYKAAISVASDANAITSELIMSVVRGDWGNGEERIRRLTEAGYDAAKVQEAVNENFSTQGEWKEGWEERLSNYDKMALALSKTKDALKDNLEYRKELDYVSEEEGKEPKKNYSFVESFKNALVTDVPKAFTWVKEKFQSIIQWFTDNAPKFDYIFGMIFEDIRNYVNAIPGRLSKAYDIIKKVFKGIIVFIESLTGIDIRLPTLDDFISFYESIRGFKDSLPGTLTSIKDSVVGFVEAITGKDLKMPTYEDFLDFCDRVKDFRENLPEKLTSIKDSIVSFVEDITGIDFKMPDFGVFSGFLEGISNVVSISLKEGTVKDIPKKVIASIPELTQSLKDAYAALGVEVKPGGVLEKLIFIKDKIGEFLSSFIGDNKFNFNTMLTKLWEYIQKSPLKEAANKVKGFVDDIKLVFKPITDTINFFRSIPTLLKEMNLEEIIKKAVTIFAGFKVFTTFLNVANIIDNASEIMEFIGNREGTLFDKIKDLVLRIKTRAEEASKGGKGLKGKIKKLLGLIRIVAIIGAIASAISSLANVVFKFGSMGPDQMTAGFVGLALIIGGLIGTLFLMNEAGSKLDAKDIGVVTSLATSLVIFAAAINMLVPPIVALGSISWKKLLQGGIAVIVIASLFIGILYALRDMVEVSDKSAKSVSGGKMIALGATMLIMANALLIAAIPVMILGLLKPEKLLMGVLAAIAIMLGFVIILKTLNVLTGDMKEGSTGKIIALGAVMLALASSLLIASIPVMIFAKLNPTRLAIGVTAAIAMLMGLVFVAKVFESIKFKPGITASVLALALALVLVSIPVIALSTLVKDPFALGVAVTACIAMLLGLVLAAKAMSNVKFKPGALLDIIVLAGALLLVSIPVIIFSKLGESIYDGLLGMALAVGSLIVMATALQYVKFSPGAMANLIMIALAAVAITIPLAVLANYNWEQLLVATIAMGAALLTLGLSLWILGKIKIPITAILDLGLLGIALIPLALGLMLLGNVAEQIQDNAWAMVALAAVVVGISIAFMIASKIGAVPLITLSAALLMFTAALAGLFAVIGMADQLKEIGGNIIDGLVGGLKKGWDAVVNFFKNLAAGILNIFRKIMGIASPSTVMEENGEFIMEGLTNGLTGGLDGIMDFFKNLGKKILAWFKEFFTPSNLKNVASKALEAGKNLISNIGKGIKAGFTAVKNVVSNIVTAIGDAFSNFMESHGLENGWDLLGWIWDNIVSGAKALGSKIYDIGSSIFGWINDSISTWMEDNGFESGWDVLKWVFTGIWNAIKNLGKGVLNVGAKIWGWISSSIKDWMGDHGFESGWDVLKWVFTGIWNAISNFVVGVIDLGSKLCGWIDKQFTDWMHANGFANGGEVLQWIFNGICEAITKPVVDVGKRLANWILTQMTNALLGKENAYDGRGTLQWVDRGVSGAISDDAGKDTTGIGGDITGWVTDSIESYEADHPTDGGAGIEKWVADGINSDNSNVVAAANKIVNDFGAAVCSREADLRALGDSMRNNLMAAAQDPNNVGGMPAYLFGKIGIDAGSNLGEGMVEGFDKATGINSPSTVMMKRGRYLVQGLAIGMEDNTSYLSDATKTMGLALNGVNDFLSGDMNIDPTITPVLDLSNVNTGFGVIRSMANDHSFDITASARNASLMMNGHKPMELIVNNANKSNDTLNNSLTNIQNELATLKNSIASMQLVMDTGALVGSISTPIDNSLQRRVVYNNRRL